MNDTPSDPVPIDPSKGTIPCNGPPTFPFDATGTHIGGFRVLTQIGEGGMGAVYLAEDAKLARRVAIKTMKPELAAVPANRDRFLREARAAAAIEHDNVVPILHVGDAADGSPFIVMPFLQGETLDARLKREGIAPLDLLLKVAAEVADGLVAAHAKGLIHRDIKPANVWLEGDPNAKTFAEQVRRCKVLDFGLARPAECGDAQLTGPGAVLGTPAYMAPEQAQSKKLDSRADLFSLAATLYRAATGKLPFDGPTPMAVLIALTTESPVPIRELAPHLPLEFSDLIDRLMRKDTAGRPRSAGEVAATVRTLIEKLKRSPVGDPLSTSYPQELLSLEQSAEVAPKPPSPPGKRRWLPWALAACFLALVPLGLWFDGAFSPKKAEGEVSKDDPPKQEPPKTDPPKKEPVTDPERAAALFVLSRRGSVGVSNDQYTQTEKLAELPKEPFHLTRVTLPAGTAVSDADMAIFKNCRHVMYLGLNDSPISDEGLASFAGCQQLTYVYLEGAKVGSKGLAALQNCPDIRELNLNETKVDDAALVEIKRFAKLDYLALQETKVTAAGVTELTRALKCQIVWDGGTIPCTAEADRKAAEWVLTAGGTVQIDKLGNEVKSVKALPKDPFNLIDISLTAKVPDTGLAVLTRCTHLTKAYLVGTGITNTGLAHLKDCTNLTELYLSGTKVDGGSVPVLKRFTKLTDLSVGQTGLVEKDVKELAKALPGCTIQWDGGTIEPKKK